MSLPEHGVLSILNQLFELEKKIKGQPIENSLQRNLRRIRSQFEEAGYKLHDPLGEKYDLTRLDCEAMAAGEGAANLKIVEVIKPIIYHRENDRNSIVQKAVVVVENRK